MLILQNEIRLWNFEQKTFIDNDLTFAERKKDSRQDNGKNAYVINKKKQLETERNITWDRGKETAQELWGGIQKVLGEA